MTLKEKLAEKADQHLISEWRDAFKWLSVQLALVAGVITTLAVSEPEKFAKLLELIPAEARPFVTIFFATVIPIYVRLKKQAAPET